ncbi:MAG: glycine--tRNA ligase subunit alpha [Candidatus Hodgkinia cicadicola]
MLNQCYLHNFACKLTAFWKLSFGAVLVETSSRRLGAATFHRQVISQILLGTNAVICFAQPTYRPFDCDFGLVNKLQRYHQYQVIFAKLNEPPTIALKRSLESLGVTNDHRLVFRKSNWRSESLNAWGIGWECLLNTVEIAQITLFKQVCGVLCNKSVWEITYGLERLNFALSGKVSKPSQIEIARSTFYKTIATSRLIRRFNSISSKELTKLPKPATLSHFHWVLLSLTDVYNKLTTKASVKKSVMRKILTKIQSNVKFIAQRSLPNV